VCGKSSRSRTVKDWKQRLALELVAACAIRDIFDVDRTGLFYNMFLDKSLS
jgi:hypothetical protein